MERKKSKGMQIDVESCFPCKSGFPGGVFFVNQGCSRCSWRVGVPRGVLSFMSDASKAPRNAFVVTGMMDPTIIRSGKLFAMRNGVPGGI
jgi:hypothetical protein